MNFLRYLKMVKFPFYTEQVRVYALPVLLFLGKRTPPEGVISPYGGCFLAKGEQTGEGLFENEALKR